jgi:hypothetical protein
VNLHELTPAAHLIERTPADANRSTSPTSSVFVLRSTFSVLRSLFVVDVFLGCGVRGWMAIFLFPT